MLHLDFDCGWWIVSSWYYSYKQCNLAKMCLLDFTVRLWGPSYFLWPWVSLPYAQGPRSAAYGPLSATMDYIRSNCCKLKREIYQGLGVTDLCSLYAQEFCSDLFDRLIKYNGHKLYDVA